MTQTYVLNPYEHLTSAVRATTEYIQAKMGSDYDVQFHLVAPSNLAEILPLDKTIIALTIDDIDDRPLGFGENRVGDSEEILTDLLVFHEPWLSIGPGWQIINGATESAGHLRFNLVPNVLTGVKKIDPLDFRGRAYSTQIFSFPVGQPTVAAYIEITEEFSDKSVRVQYSNERVRAFLNGFEIGSVAPIAAVTNMRVALLASRYLWDYSTDGGVVWNQFKERSAVGHFLAPDRTFGALYGIAGGGGQFIELDDFDLTEVHGITTEEQATYHEVNFDLGVWASDDTGGTTALLRAREKLAQMFISASAATEFSEATDGINVRRLAGGQFITQKFNDVVLHRMIGGELVVVFYGKTRQTLTTITDIHGEGEIFIDGQLIVQ